VDELIANSSIPVVNALDDYGHPCQVCVMGRGRAVVGVMGRGRAVVCVMGRGRAAANMV